MSNNKASNLTCLLRLLADEASAAESQQLQVRMREDEVLKIQYEKLIQVTTQPISIEQSLLHVHQVDPELIAAFIDGGLSAREQVAFERQCWNSDSLLREVAAAWQLEVETGPADRPRNGSVATLNSSLSAGKSSAQMTNTVATGKSVADVVPVIDARSPQPLQPSRRSRRFEQHVWVALASAVVISGVLFGAWKLLTSEHELPGAPDDRQVVEQKLDSPGDDLERVVQDTQPEAVPDLESLPDSQPDSELPRMRQPDRAIVEAPNINQPEINPDPIIPPRPDLEQPPSQVSNVAEWLAWSKVDGIAATRNAENSKWRGIESPNNYVKGESIPWVQVATFDASRLQGDARNGSTWTADANTSFRISQHRASTPLEASNQGGVVVCELLLGKLAIENLVEGQSLYLRINARNFKVNIDEQGTTLVVYRNAKGTVLGVFGGAVSSGSEVVTRQAWKQIDAAGKIVTWRPESYDAWYNVPIRKQAAPATLRNALNGAPDFLAQAIDIGRTGTSLEKSIVANAILQCSASDTKPPNERQLRMMLNSPDESVRATLVRWLYKQFIENPRYGQAMLQEVCRIHQVPEEVRKLTRSWFDAAAQNEKYNRGILAGLLGSLSTDSAPVVRQIAKFFLERFLDQPLDQYNPLKPGPEKGPRSAIENVRVMVSKQLSPGR